MKTPALKKLSETLAAIEPGYGLRIRFGRCATDEGNPWREGQF